MSISTSDAAKSIRRHSVSVRRGRPSLIYRWLREPLLHFLLSGGLIFVASYVVQHERSPADRQIIVDDRVRKRIIEINQAQSGFIPGQVQLDGLIEGYVDDEVLYREAVRLGLDRDDEIVRRRLIQKMLFLQHDLVGAAAPPEEVLHAFYDAHAALFTSPSRVSFEQLFFSADRGGWEEAALRARRAREQLIRESPSAAPADDAFPLEIPAGALSRTDAGRIFGETAIVDALFSAPQGRWSEPVRSAYGWHLIKPAHREASSIASYATVRPQVEAVYLQQQAQVSERHELDTLRARYEIIRQDKRGPGL